MVWPCFKVFWIAKTILQGTVKGKRKRGRQKKRWEDNIKEWTGMDFANSTRAAENRKRWKEIVANRIHLWCPDDLPIVFKGEFMLFYEQTSAKNVDCNHRRNRFSIGD